MDRSPYTNPPKRRIGAQAVLLHPEDDRVLLLNMLHRPCGWLPGGHCAPNEPALEAVRRIVRLQLGITVPIDGTDLALVDYSPARMHPEASEGYTFVFAHRLTTEHAALAQPQELAGPDLLGLRWIRVAAIGDCCLPYHVLRITRAVAVAESGSCIAQFVVRGVAA
ncbi:NUDIX domain-containing protein [Kitasatospora sp. NPDC006697]|uniref:NUDIX domain-containing protein n=1 Tax=Kitasatospora sp. NPDC006697 TaxID=3364020 RepID=UPI0036BE4E77